MQPGVVLERISIARPLHAGSGNRRVFAIYAVFAIVLIAVLGTCFALGLDTFSASRRRALRLVQLGLVTASSSAFLLVLWRRAWPARTPGWLAHASATRTSLWCAGLALAAAALVATLVLQSVPLSGDEGAYVFQAGMFAQGRLWWPVSPFQPYIAQPYIFPYEGRLISQYPPGWPAMLSAALASGVPPALVNPVVGALTILALYRFALVQYGKEIALLAAAMTGVSAFFLFNSGSFYNGSVTALFAVLMAHSAARFLDRPGVAAALGTGLWFSAIAVVRHFDAVLFALPVAVALLWRGTWRHWRLTPLAILAGVPLLALLLLYYTEVTGSPLLLPQKLHSANDGLLGANWHAVRVTEILVGRLVELAEWVSPPFVLAMAWALVLKLRDRSIRFYDLYGPVFLAGYWLYWADGTLRWGPRYIYPALPFMALLVAEQGWRAVRDRPGFAHLAAVSLLVAALQTPFLALRGRDLISQTQDIPRQVAAAGLHNAVVVVVSGTGLLWQIEVADLARNGLSLDRDVIYAHGPGLPTTQTTPDGVANAVRAFRAGFPGRSIWLYQRGEGQAAGQLVPA